MTDWDDITFGLAAPLQRSFGENSRFGAELAAADINAAGGIDGRKIQVPPQDDGGDGASAITAASALVNASQVLAVVGHANSGPLMAAAPIYTEGELPAIGTSATSTDLAGAGPWIFRIASNDSANDDYGRSLAQVFRQALAGTDAQLVGYDPHLEETQDFRPYLTRLKSNGAEVFLVAGWE